MGWTNQAVILFVLIEPKSGFSGIFVYSPGFAAGDLTASMAAVTGEDPKGNHYLPLIAAYAPPNAAQLNGDGVAWHSGSEAGGWTGRASLVLDSTEPTFMRLSIGGPDPQGVVAIIGPSSDQTGVADAAAINLALTLGISEVRLLPGQYYLSSTISMGVGQYVRGSGMAGTNATIISWLDTGDCFRQSFDGTYSQSVIGGGITGLTIDGTGSTAPSAGIHAGDIESLCYDQTIVRNFSGAGDIGYHFDNHYNFTERLQGRLEAINCTTAVVLDVTSNTGPSPDSSTPSFARCDIEVLITTFAVEQDGMVLQNGAALYDGRLGIYGNFTGAASGVPGAVLTLTGTVPAGHPAAGAGSRIEFSRLDAGVESTAGTVTAQTIEFGAGSNVILDTTGLLDFGAVNTDTFTPSNLAAAGATFRHNGTILGDATLPATVQYGTHTVSAPLGDGSTIFTNQGGNIAVSTTAPVTGIILAPGSRDGQQATIVNTSGNTITFDVAATSHVASGTSAVIAANAGAVFVWNAAQSLWYHAGAGA